MNRAYKDARDTAKLAAREGRYFLDDKSKYAYKIGQRMQRAYPALVSNLGNSAREQASQWREAFRARGKDAAAASARLYAHGKGRVEFKLLTFGAMYALWRYFSRNPTIAEAGERVKAEVKAEPLQSAVIALGIGFLVGKLLG